MNQPLQLEYKIEYLQTYSKTFAFRRTWAIFLERASKNSCLNTFNFQVECYGTFWLGI